MSREILFRGLSGGNFVYGNYISQALPSGALYEAIQCEIDGSIREVVIGAGTVGQYTGRKDCDGVKIFEGDIAEDDEHYLSKIYWDDKDSMFCASDVGGLADMSAPIKVIGNIHQHSELLKGGSA